MNEITPDDRPRSPIPMDCHMHTPLCGHAQGMPVEYVGAAAQRGLKRITFTCHTPLDEDGFGGPRIRMAPERLPEYTDLIAEAREFGKEIGVEVLLGIEAEITPNQRALDRMDALLAETPFDFILGSLHHQLPSYRELITGLGLVDDASIIRHYFETVIQGIESGRYHSVAHPDVIRIYGTVEPFHPKDYEPEIRAVVRAAAQRGVCLEINTSGLTKGVFELHPHPLILSWVKEEGALLTIGSDSHKPASVAQFFPEVVETLTRIGIESLNYFESGKRVEVPLARSLEPEFEGR